MSGLKRGSIESAMAFAKRISSSTGSANPTISFVLSLIPIRILPPAVFAKAIIVWMIPGSQELPGSVCFFDNPQSQLQNSLCGLNSMIAKPVQFFANRTYTNEYRRFAKNLNPAQRARIWARIGVLQLARGSNLEFY